MKCALTLLFAFFAQIPSWSQAFGPLDTLITDFNFTELEFTDLDGDDDVDMIVSLFSQEGMRWIENDGGSFDGPNHIILATPNYEYCNEILMVDVENDGEKDMVYIDGYNDRCILVRNLGGGIFSTETDTIAVALDFARNLSFADLDLDGDLDLYLTSWSSFGRIRWYENLGGGQFASEQIIITLNEQIRDMETADMDGDGIDDLLYCTDVRVMWTKNLGGGLFGAHYNIAVIEDIVPSSICSLDMDQDGDLDVIAGYNNDRVLSFENTGNGYFTSEYQVLLETNGRVDMKASDVDLDGMIDVVFIDMEDDNTSHVGWFPGLGNGYFNPAEIIGEIANSSIYQSFYMVDIDGDMDLDVLVGTSYNDHLLWAENLALSPTSLPEIVSDQVAVRLVPNPVEESSEILLKAPYTKLSYQVLTVLGQVVQERQVDKVEGSVILDRGDLATGNYILRLLIDDEPAEVKFSIR